MSLLSRREFSGLCVAFGSLTTALDTASSKASTTAERTAKFRDGTVVSALGQGLRASERENVLKLRNKKRYARAFLSE